METNTEKRGPGRPPRKEQNQKRRRRREGMGIERNLRLFIPEDVKDPDYHYHWINDKPGRLHARTVQDDYDIVTEEELKGEKHDGEGTQVKRAIGTGENGEWMYSYLCRKPKDFYVEDKAKEQERIAQFERQAREGIPASNDGLDTDDHAYVPEGRRNVIGR